MSLSQIHKRNRKKIEKHVNRLPLIYIDLYSKGWSKAINHTITLSLIDGMVEMVEGMKIPVEKMKHDLKGKWDFERNKTLSDLKSLLLAQREIIENEK